MAISFFVGLDERLRLIDLSLSFEVHQLLHQPQHLLGLYYRWIQEFRMLIEEQGGYFNFVFQIY